MDQPLPPIIPPTPSIPVELVIPKPLKKPFPKWFFIAFFAFIFSIASVFVYQKLQPARSNLADPSPSPIAVLSSPSTDPTANWQTYTISLNGLNFKYPVEEEVFADINDRTALAADKLYMIGYSGTDQMSLKISLYKSEMTSLDWWNIEGKNKFEKLAEEGGKLNNPPQIINLSYQEKNITFVGKQALQVTVFSSFETPHTPKENSLMIFQNQGYITMVSYSQSFEKSLEISRQILSTFKFTD